MKADSMMLPLGEVIAWMSKATSHAALVGGLSKAGLDPALARELLPRYAFSRALRKMEQDRVIRQVSEDKTHILFQFTAEAKRGDRFVYDLEATLTLNKATGKIECSKAGLETAAETLLAECMEARTASDVTAIVQKVLKGRGDLFPINPNGGAYFVPHAHRGLIDQVQVFLGEIGGAVNRFAVSQGDKATESSVRTSMADGLAAAIYEYEAAIEDMDMDTRPDTIKRAADRIKVAKFKVESYAALLGDQKARLEACVAEAQAKLKAKVKLLGKSMPVEGGTMSVAGARVASYTPPAAAHIDAGAVPVVPMRFTMPIVVG